MDTQFYNTYIYFIFAENAFYPIGGGKGSPDFERRLEKIKRYLEKKGYKITQNDVEVRKDIIIVWSCPDEDKLKSFVDAIFKLLKKLDRKIEINLSLSFPPTSKAKNFESTIMRLWDVKKDVVIRKTTDDEINDKILSNYGDGLSRILAYDATPRCIINLNQELDVYYLITEKIQGAKYIHAVSDIKVNENIQKVEKLKTNLLKCGGIRFCGNYSEDIMSESEILLKNFVCDGSVESCFISFGSEKSDEVLKAKRELEIKKLQAINYFNDKAIMIRRQIITDQKFGLTMKDKKWIKFIFEHAQRDFKKSPGRESVLDYLVDLLTQQEDDVYVGPIIIVYGKKYRIKKEVASLRNEKENILKKMDEVKINMQKHEQEIVEYKERIRKEYWENKLYLTRPFGEFWLEKLKQAYGERENVREKLRELFEKLIGTTTLIEVFDNSPEYYNFLTIYKSFHIIHREMTKKLIELVTKNEEYIAYLAGDTAKLKEPNFIANSLNNSVIRLDYNDFVFIRGMVSQSKIFGGTNNRVVILGDINTCNFECDDISIKGNIDANSRIVAKSLTAEKCSQGVKISAGPGSRILYNSDEYLEEFEFRNGVKNVSLNEMPGRHNVYEINFVM